jgi:hypothetical protein
MAGNSKPGGLARVTFVAPGRGDTAAACRNIVRLRGVGANDLTDLVSMRESMFVVQVRHMDGLTALAFAQLG